MFQMFATMLLSAAVLTGETSHPTNSFFARGTEAFARITAHGFAAGKAHPLTCEVRDWRENRVSLQTQSFVADGKGGATVSFPLPTDRYGFFKFIVRSGDVALKKRGSCPAGFLTYAVVRAPGERPPLTGDETFFGAMGGKTRDYPWMGLHETLVRPFPVPEGQKPIEVRDPWPMWGTVYVSGSLSYGMGAFNAFWSKEGLAWLKADNAKGGANRKQRVIMDPVGSAYLLENFKGICRAARRQAPSGQTKRIYEPISEVDLQLPSPEHSVRLAKLLREAIDAEDPEDGLTCMPGVSHIRDITMNQQLIEAGILDYLNAYSFHPYISYPPEPNGFLRNIRAVQKMIRDRLGHDLPYYSTEQGFNVSGSPEDEAKKLNGQLRTNFIMLGEGFVKSYLFHCTDFGNDYDTAKDGDYGLLYNLGLHEPGGTRHGPMFVAPRAIAAGLAAATWYVDGKRPTSCLEGAFGETSLGYAYQGRDGAVVIVLWDFGGKPVKATLPVGRERVTVADVMGNETVREAPGGLLSLELTETPVYVVNPDAKMWGRGGTMAKKLQEESRRRAAAREAAIRLKLVRVSPDFDGADPAVAVTVENRTDTPRTATVSVRIPGEPLARRSAHAKVAARAKATLRVRLDGFRPDPERLCNVRTVATLDDGYSATREDVVNFWRAERMADGFAAWRPTRYDGTAARFAFGWDDEGLAGEILVSDDVHCNRMHGFHTWNGDSVQLGFARQVLEKLTDNNLTDLALQAPSEMTLALTETGVETYRTRTFDPRLYPATMDGKGLIPSGEMPVTVERIGEKTTRYRFRLPWRFVNLERVARGDTVRMAAFVNRRDVPTGPVAQGTLFALQQDVPRKFGWLVLAEPCPAERPSGGRGRLVRHGSFGQSQSADAPAIPWMSCPWLVADAAGDVHFPQGFVWRSQKGRVETESPQPAPAKPQKVAETAAGTWRASAYGAAFFPTNSPRESVRHVGGVGLESLAVSGGRVVGTSLCSILQFSLDDAPGDPLLCSASWPWQLPTKTWRDHFTAIDAKDGVFHLCDRNTGRVVRYDPSVEDWPHRENRYRDAPGVKVVSDGRSARLGTCHVARLTDKGIGLYRTGSDGREVLEDRVEIAANMIAGEGEWLVAYVPSRREIVRYRLVTEE